MGASAPGRSVLVGVLALAVAAIVLRDATVEAYADARPGRAAAAWANHPQVLVSQALTEIGQEAAQSRSPPREALAKMTNVAVLSPLLHDPFLVRGISLQQAGRLPLAEQSFLAARQRAPREAAPRYFLSQLYLTTGREKEGLGELATLARLLPNGPASVAPSLAAYARTSGSYGLKPIFRNHAELESAVLVEMAKDPANANLALRLATRFTAPDGTAPDWAKVMLPKLAGAGEFEQAYRVWRAVGGTEARGALFDPGFAGSPAPPPFNWAFRSDSAGFAEPDRRGGLHVLFYGREDSLLAGQTTLLAPGRYRLAMRVAGNPAGALRWSVKCAPGTAELLSMPLGDRANAGLVGEFTVGGDCPAQRFELIGRAGDLPRQVDVTISALSLRGNPNGR